MRRLVVCYPLPRLTTVTTTDDIGGSRKQRGKGVSLVMVDTEWDGGLEGECGDCGQEL